MMTATAAELPLHGPWPTSVEKCLQFVRVSSESWLSLCLGSINRDLSVDFWRTKGFKWSFTDFFFHPKSSYFFQLCLSLWDWLHSLG